MEHGLQGIASAMHTEVGASATDVQHGACRARCTKNEAGGQTICTVQKEGERMICGLVLPAC